MKTFYEYLMESDSIDFHIRVNRDGGELTFYIHPQNEESETLDFWMGTEVPKPYVPGEDFPFHE